MQTLIYTDASLKENENGIAVELQIEDKSYFFRFSNIKFPKEQYNSNIVEALGVILGIALASQYEHERIFVFNDNAIAMKILKEIEFKNSMIFNQFKNIQIAWLQNDMPQMKLVDYLSRVDFKKFKEFNLDKIKYKEIVFDEELVFNHDNFNKYLENNCFILKRLMGFEPKLSDLNKMVVTEMFDSENKKAILEKVSEFDPSFKNKEKIINDFISKQFTPLIVKKKPIVANDKLEISTTPCFITEQIIEETYHTNPRTPKHKINTEKVFNKNANKKIIKEPNTEIQLFINNVYYPIKTLIEDNKIVDFIDKSYCDDSDKFFLIRETEKNKLSKNSLEYIEKSNNKKYILIFLKIFNLKLFNEIIDKSKIILRKDYKRGIPSICRYYNKTGKLY